MKDESGFLSIKISVRRMVDMTEQEAKTILSSYGPPINVAKHVEAINFAVEKLGGRATMTEIWRWASERTEEADKGTV